MKKIKQTTVFTLSALSAALLCQTATSYASDIEIYKAPTTGGAHLMLVLDESASMSHGEISQTPITNDFKAGNTNWCQSSLNSPRTDRDYYFDETHNKVFTKLDETTEQYSYRGRYCLINKSTIDALTSTKDKEMFRNGCTLLTNYNKKRTGVTKGSGRNTYIEIEDVVVTPRDVYKCSDRMTALKHSLSDLIGNRNYLPDTAIIGMTVFPSPKVLHEPVLLNDEGRLKLLKKIDSFGAGGSTPIAQGYSYGATKLLDSISTGTAECAGYGVYFLTDGEPRNDVFTGDSGAISNNNLNKYLSTGYKLTNVTSSGRNPTTTGNCTDSWACTETAARFLYNKKHSQNVELKTAIVGFGSEFSFKDSSGNPILYTENLTEDEAAALFSGTYQKAAARAAVSGKGGWFSADNTADIVSSVKNFVNSIKVPIPAITTGTATIPQDALNAVAVQPYAYFPQFKPQPSEDFQLWSGNLKKFKVVNSILIDADNETVFKLNNNGTVTTTDDYTELNVNAKDLWVRGVTDTSLQSLGGVLSKLQLKMANNKFSRKVITNSNTTLSTVDSDYILSSQKGTTSLLTNKKYLLGLLGYNFTETELLALNGNSNLTSPASSKELRNIGSVMHSIPVLLTQSGKVTYDTNVNTSDRDDYLLFGTTQGVLHVVQAGLESETTDSAYTGGKEVFAFVPQEMLDSQPRALLSEEESGENGMDSLHYGVDGSWVAHTEYVYKADEDKFVTQYNAGTVAAPNWKKGKQWVYGGMRMGGRSYYALDLTDITNPSIKFRIDPTTSKVYTSATTTTKTATTTTTTPITNYTYSHLAKMGQSWSKPVIANVQWKGKRRLVMFVGGGYDSGYETFNYDQDSFTQSTITGTGKGIGAGVFMFDANTGEPLWSTYEAVDSTKPADAPYIGDGNELKYSVASQIKAIDREGDGDVDHLYFGDLGGHVFRIDLNSGHSTSSTSNNFAKNIVLLLNVHKENGVSPRFYETPGFSIYSGTTGNFAVVSIGSGNRSNPLLGKLVNSNYIVRGETATLNETLENDAIYNLFDTDVVQKNSTTLSLQDVTTSNLVAITDLNRELGTIATGATAPANKANFTNKKGWYYAFNSSTGRKAIEKVQGDVIVIDNDLYVSTFDAESVGTTEACGAGIYGGSKAHRFCMPYGQCPEDDTVANNTLYLGKGLLGLTLGGGSDGNNSSRSVVVPLSSRSPATNKILSAVYKSNLKLTPLSWYEKN